MPNFELDEEDELSQQQPTMEAPKPIIDPAEYKAAQEEEDRKLLYLNLAKAANTIGTGMATPQKDADQSFYNDLQKQNRRPSERIMELGKSKASEQAMLQKYLTTKAKLDANSSNSLNDFTSSTRGEYLKPTKMTHDMETYYSNVEKAAKGGTPASDISLTFALMKLYDPTSSVRESEVATVSNSGSIPDQFTRIYNKVLDGQQLTPAQRADFLRTAQDRLKSQYEAQDSTDEYYKNIIASKPGVDPNLVIAKRRFDTKFGNSIPNQQIKEYSKSEEAGISNVMKDNGWDRQTTIDKLKKAGKLK